MDLEVDAAASEGDSFHFEAESLIEGGVALELDFSAGPDNTLPRQIDTGMQSPNDLTGSPRVARSFGDGAIGGDVAARDRADGSQDVLSHR